MIIVGGVILLAIIIGAILIFSGRGGASTPERAVGNYIDAMFDGDARAVLRLTPFDLDAVEQEIRMAEGMSQREFRDMLQNWYGVNSIAEVLERELVMMTAATAMGARVEHRVVDRDQLSPREVRDWVDSMRARFEWSGLDADNIMRLNEITDVVELRVEMRMSALGFSDEYTEWFTAVRIGRSWYVVDPDLMSMLVFMW